VLLRRLIAIVLAALGALSGARATETIVFWYGASQKERAAIEGLVADFHRAHPGIRVRAMLTPMAQIQQKLLLSVAGGVPPDVVRFYTDLGGELMAREGLERVDHLARRDGVDLKAFYPVALQQNTFKGRLYGMPWVLSPKALFYNRRLFREAGLDPDRPPRTWDELRSAALRLTKKDSRGNITQLGFGEVFEFRCYLWQSGGELLSPDGREPAWNSETGVRTLEWWKRFADEQAGDFEQIQRFNSQFSGAATDSFGTEKVAMRLDSPFRIPDLQLYFPKLDYGIASIPTNGATVSEVVGNSLVIPRGSRHVEAAWTFIKFATTREQQLKVCRASGRLPARIDAANDPSYRNDPRLGPFARQLPFGRSIPVVPGYMEMAAALDRQLEQAYKGNLSPREALDRAAAEGRRILSRSMEDVSPLTPVNWRRVIGGMGLLYAALAAGGVAFVRSRTGGSKRARREAVEFFGFLTPWLIGFSVFTFGAVSASLVLSFSRWDVLTPGRWVGFRNYADLFFRDPRFVKSLVNTLVYTAMAVPLGVAAGLATAMLMNTKVAGIRFYRTLFYLPVVVSGVATAMLWSALFNPSTGLVNRLLTAPVLPSFAGGLHWVPLVASPPGWLADPAWAKPSLVVMALWGVGGAMLIYLAGLQGIPGQLYEAAELDGARGWRRFRHITLPLLTPVIFYQLVMGIIGSFQVFTQAFVMTGGSGAPEDSLLFYVLYLFNNAFQWLKMGYASAMAWILLVIVLLVTLVNFVLAKRWVYYEGGTGR
jgi:multiple sugar transport system permease protein